MLVASGASPGPVVGWFGAGTAPVKGSWLWPWLHFASVLPGCCLGGKCSCLWLLVVLRVLLWGVWGCAGSASGQGSHLQQGQARPGVGTVPHSSGTGHCGGS